MSYTDLIFALAVVLIAGPWLWRHKIKPFYAKSEYQRFLQNHPNRINIERILRLLTTLYKRINSEAISHRDRKSQSLQDDAYVYGEIDFLSFISILEKAKPEPGEIFYDLGSGGGKAVFTAALCYELSKACGIERLPGLYKLANTQINKAIALINLSKQESTKTDLQRVQAIHFVNSDFLHYDISDGDIIFINATCLGYCTWEALVEKLKKIKPGSRVIVTTKKIQNEQFELLYHGFELMSWGVNSVNIYIKVH